MKRLFFGSLFFYLFGLAGIQLLAYESEMNYSISSPQERIGNLALQKVNWNWKSALPDWHIIFVAGRPNELGLFKPITKIIEMSVRSGLSPIDIAANIAHELGHAFDNTYLTPELRRQWLEARHLPLTTKWYPCDRCTDYMFGAGDFAEAFSWTLQGAGSAFNHRCCQNIGPPPDVSQIDLIRRWMVELPLQASE